MSGIMQNRKDEPFDIVKKPKHYNQGKYEAIDVIEDWKLNLILEIQLSIYQGQGIKII